MGATWDPDPDGFLLRFFMIFSGDVSLRTCSPPPPLESLPFPPLVPAVLITPKGAESPGSGHMGVIGVLINFFHLRLFRINFTLPGRPSSALRH